MILEGNLTCKPFSSDPLLHGEVGRLIGKWSVEVAVETGTQYGYTALALSLLCQEVITVELNPANAEAADVLFRAADRRNIRLYQKSSAEAIVALQGELQGRRALYYLDAHWNDYWPLLDELKAISGIVGPKPVIVIHDFQVPGHPDLGFDVYKGTALNLDYVSRGLDEIYQGRSCIHYNTLAFGCRRGVLYVEPED